MTKPPYDPTTSRYAIARGTARRARMLWAGCPSLLPVTSRHPCRVAIAEQRAGVLPLRIISLRERSLHIVKAG